MSEPIFFARIVPPNEWHPEYWVRAKDTTMSEASIGKACSPDVCIDAIEMWVRNSTLCSECGSLYWWHWQGDDPGRCFICDFWLTRIARHRSDPCSSFIIEGNAYTAYGHSNEPPHSRGFGGSYFSIVRYLDGSRHETNNLWCQGPIPTRFRERLSDTARFERRAGRE